MRGRCALTDDSAAAHTRSPRSAVDITRARAEAAGLAGRLHAFVCDVTRAPLVPQARACVLRACSPTRLRRCLRRLTHARTHTSTTRAWQVPAASCDAVTLVFALSAMSPETMPAAVRHVAAALAPGGAVLVRDYASGDLAETRLQAKQQKLGESFYVRGDGTRAYYFSPEVLCALFAAEGLACVCVDVQERGITNRAQGVTMERRWIQATFVHAPPAGESAAAPLLPPLLADDARAATAAAGPVTEAEGVASTGGELFGALFAAGGGDPAAAAASSEPLHIASAGRQLRLRLLGREHQHTERATGAMLWEGARALAEHIAVTPGVIARGSRVLELGAGAAALPAMAATAAGAALVVATDGHPGVLQLAERNLADNGFAGDDATAAARILPLRLRWGHAADAAAVRAAGTHDGASSSDADELYDLVLGADVVYDAAALPALFATAASLLRRPGGALLLCHVADRGGVSEAQLERAAAGAKMQLCDEALAPQATAALEGAPRCRLLRGVLCDAEAERA
jgi:methyltransferase-like protein 6